MLKITLLFLLLATISIHCEDIVCDKCKIPGYYWRDFYGEIPDDAFATSGEVFIGQGFLPKAGLTVGLIHPGENYIMALQSYSPKIKSSLKILCGESNKFEWVEADRLTFERVVSTEAVVLAGWQFGAGILYIGRGRIDGVEMIGRVDAHSKQLTLIDTNGTPRQFATYEMLKYNKLMRSWKSDRLIAWKDDKKKKNGDDDDGGEGDFDPPNDQVETMM